MRHLAKILIFLIFITALGTIGLAGYVAYEGYNFLNAPAETPGREVVFQVQPGETFDQAARRLQEQGLVSNMDYFRVLGQWKGKLGSIQAGEFVLHSHWKPEQVLEALVSGPPRLYKLSLREGLTWRQTAEIVQEAGFADYDDFAAAVRDKELLAKHNIPFDTAEGFLFPNTYLLQKPQQKDAKPVVELLLASFWEQTKEIWPEPPAPDELKRVVTLASMVEKESGVSPERPRIAGVFANRLKRKMLLQSDVTIIYGLGDAFNGNLTKKHLQDRDNPYNTYTRAGLPPTPICSPGLESLKAAAQPEEHNYLYFVSKQDGSHYFSKSLKEHNNAVRKYQLKR